ncbi:hypothetical protein TVAG_038920 [Trichomonas vaginalis G3]|uniref:Uncharacterized protein n=1 Tax=Trichomonas vaginalis (strain ATCC PRA-98 / G3) TaxID=412133 RepID=A2E5K4_TRIV3|nr:hypothetical protein TVAGG3_0240220 [Trichomonas vaginalis G3]EAY12045.1 hypothetical protein TVAG_038920 [Trichomonas vaginalis G3]KAI5553271.1 hypothetical protein TVAGG3_0240220 [Trichomonas vaginalis G3]|eukprot:XP_001324268.1 hypothetical protein [Trichomonas vaginalis G3]
MAEEIGITIRPKKDRTLKSSSIQKRDDNSVPNPSNLKSQPLDNKEETTPIPSPVSKEKPAPELPDRNVEIWEPDGTLNLSALPKQIEEEEINEQNTEVTVPEIEDPEKREEQRKEFFERQQKSVQKRLNPDSSSYKEAWGHESDDENSTKPKKKFVPDPDSFFERQKRSTLVRNEAQREKKQPKPKMSNGSKAILKKDPKPVKNEVEVPQYSFHPDQSLTLDYPTNNRISVTEVEIHCLNRSIKQGVNELDNTVLEEISQQHHEDPNVTKKRNMLAKRAQKRLKQKEENPPIEREEEDIEYRPINPKVPKATREMNQYFKLFKEDLPSD